MEPDVRAKLREVRALLSDEKRWLKAAFENEERTAFCLNGAIDKVTGYGESDHLEGYMIATECRVALREHLDERFGKRFGSRVSPLLSIVYFNDHPDTTHADVIALLDKTIGDEGD